MRGTGHTTTEVAVSDTLDADAPGSKIRTAHALDACELEKFTMHTHASAKDGGLFFGKVMPECAVKGGCDINSSTLLSDELID
jgi:hypothetical protein